MKQYYMLLGLREDANLSEVEAAYERQIQKYKSDAYADDPVYSKRKCRELEHAYVAIRLYIEKGYVVAENKEVAVQPEPAKPIRNIIELEGEPDFDFDIPMSGEVRAEKPETDTECCTIETPHADARLRQIKEREKKAGKIAVAVIAVLVVLLGMIPQPPSFDPEGHVYITEYAQAEANDLYIAEIASAAKKRLDDYAVKYPKEETKFSFEEGSDEQSRWETKFVKTYWGKQEFGRVFDHLTYTYEGYECDRSYSWESCKNAAYAFYGFYNSDEILGYISPYTGRVINSTLDMYKFYVKFYEEYSKSADLKTQGD